MRQPLRDHRTRERIDLGARDEFPAVPLDREVGHLDAGEER